MEQKGAILVGLVGFGFVGFVLIKLASQINTNPQPEHYKPSPVPTPSGPEPYRSPTPDPYEQKRAADRERSTLELLVDVAASQYAGRVGVHAHNASPWSSEDAACVLVDRGPAKKQPPASAGSGSERERSFRYEGTFRCMAGDSGVWVIVPVDMLFTGGRWEIHPETRKVLDEGGLLDASWRVMTTAEIRRELTPAPQPAQDFHRGVR